MAEYIIIFISILAILLLLVAVAIYFYDRKQIQMKDRSLLYYIREKDRIEKELEYVRIEKDTMEKVFTEKLEYLTQASTSETEKKADKEYIVDQIRQIIVTIKQE